MTSVIGHEDSGWVSATTDQLNERVDSVLNKSVGYDPNQDRLSTFPKEELERLNYQGVEIGKSLRNLTVTSTSPKSLDSSHKIPVNLCPASAIIAIALVIAQGHKKPGRSIYNWRSQPISLMSYMAGVERHLLKSRDGEDFDEELSQFAGVPIRHDWAAMSGLAIIEDARQAGTLVDDRPVKGGAAKFLEEVTVKK